MKKGKVKDRYEKLLELKEKMLNSEITMENLAMFFNMRGNLLKDKIEDGYVEVLSPIIKDVENILWGEVVSLRQGRSELDFWEELGKLVNNK